MVTKWLRLIPLLIIPITFGLSPYVASVSAASATISVQPKNGTFKIGEIIDASIKIDGGGTAFNAAKANISTSENLKVERLTLGDCGFAFVDTPTTTSPSFAGVILGGSKQTCNVFDLTLRVVGPNSGFVYISEGSIKSYSGASEILSGVENSSYTITGTSSQEQSVDNKIETVQPPLASPNGDKLYSVVYSINADPSKASDLVVLLDPNLPTQMQTNVSPLLEDRTILAAVFDNVPEGVHTIEVRENGNVLSSEVVNLEGDNREINLGVQPKLAPFSLLSIALIALGSVIVIAAGIFGYIYYWKKKHTSA